MHPKDCEITDPAAAAAVKHAFAVLAASKVSVLSKSGTKLGEVNKMTTSIGASKVAGGPCEWSYKLGAWIKK